MNNLKELEKMLQNLKKEFYESVEKKNEKAQEYFIKEILRVELIVKEEEVMKESELIKAKLENKIEFVIEEEEVIGQESLEKAFSDELKKVYSKYKDHSNVLISNRQAETIRNGMRDRVGMELNPQQIKFINSLNQVQASNVIRILSGISFYNQRKTISKAVNTIKNEKPEIYFKLLAEVKSNSYKKEWFELNQELIRISDELTPATDAQVRRIVDLAKYIETRYTLLNDFDIDVDAFEERTDANYYKFNFNKLKQEISKKFNKQNAYNFIQTYDYISNFYEGNKLDNEQANHIRSLYTRLGEYENTKLTFISCITKSNYDKIVLDLEKRIRENKIANNYASKDLVRELFQETYRTNSKAINTTNKQIKLNKEQTQAKEMVSFVNYLYSCIGQDLPQEMNEILPYFVEGGEIKYASIEEEHYSKFRKMVFEQREVIKEIDPSFNWGNFICRQPTHILKALGLDFMV